LKEKLRALRLEVDRDYANTTFTVSDEFGFASESFTLPNYNVQDYQIEQARQNIAYAYDVDSGMQQVKQALGIYS
jgi:hypothetical protein